MSLSLTPDQLRQLQSPFPGSVSKPLLTSAKDLQKPSKDITNTHPLPLNTGNFENHTVSSSHINRLLTQHKSSLFPVITVSGITLFTFAGVVLLKSKVAPPPVITSTRSSLLPQVKQPTPTQVPRSIQHYLLTSQQFFTQALQLQNSTPQSPEIVNLLNQSIVTATDAIKAFPTDSRSWEQRARIYQSLLDSQPQLLPQAISDFSQAQKLNSQSVDLTRTLAGLYARQGDTQNTLSYLTQTASLEPTKAQNFYDLAKLQEKAGRLPQALNTYQHLLTLLTDTSQIQTVQSEVTTLQKLVAQNPSTDVVNIESSSESTPSPSGIILPDSPPKLKAMADTGLLIAAPETSKSITVNNLTESNSLAGEAKIAQGSTQITIPNSKLTPSSQIYLTITEGSSAGSIQVLSKTTDSFTAGFDSPQKMPITFKWWIIN